MGLFKMKQYGRPVYNKLDILISVVFAVISVASLWTSIGIAIANAGPLAKYAFFDVWHSMIFMYCAPSLTIEIIFSLLFYGGLALLVCGSIFLHKKGKGERIPGLFAAFFALLGFMHFFAFHFEYAYGQAAGTINPFWTYSLLLFIIALFAGAIFLVILTFSSYDVRLKSQKVDDYDDYDDKQNYVADEEKDEEEEQPEEESEEEEIEEEEVDEEEDEENEEDDEEDEDEEDESEESIEGNGFNELGKRRRQIPFENRLRKCGPQTRERYNVIVAALRKYKFNDRVSIGGETFSYKRNKIVYITFTGATLKVYFSLDPKEFEESSLPIRDASGMKKYAQTPSCLRIKSNLASRRAIALVERLAQENNVPPKKK